MNIVEFVVKLKDMASGPLQKLQQTGTNSFTKIQQSMDKLSGRSNALKQSINDLDAQIEKLKRARAISLDGSQIERINKQLTEVEAKKERLEGGRKGGGLGSFFRSGLAIAGIGILAFLGKDIMQAGIERQMNATALQTLVGKAPGTLLNNQLLDFAKKSIYGNEVFTEGKLMAGSGIKANNIMPVMRMIGDIAMGDKERMKSLALAFSEASTRGSLSGMNERMFLQGGLFNPLEQLHKMTGRSMANLKKDMSKGKISIDELVRSMQYATGPMGRWHDMMDKMQNTPAGKWTAFTGTVRTLAGTIGLELLPVLGGLVDILQGIIGNPDAMYLIANAIGAITAAWGIYSVAVNWAAIQTGLLEAAAMWPVALAVGILGGIMWLCTGNDSLADNTESTAQRISNASSLIRDSWTNTGYVLETALLGIMSVFERVYNYMGAIAHRHGAWKALTGDTDADIRLAKLKADHDAAKWAELDAKNGFVSIDKKTGKPVKTTPSALDALMGYKGGTYNFDGKGGGAASAGDTSKAITGGGVRNIYINVAKFQDKTEIHSASLRESVAEVERQLEDMFDRIVNSAATALN